MFYKSIVIFIVVLLVIILGYYLFMRNSDNNKTSLEQIAELATQYHYGTDDITPDAYKALFYYGKLVKNGYIDYLFDMANIFHYGMVHFKACPQIAESIYNVLLRRGNEEQRTTAKMRLHDLYDEPIDNSDEYYVVKADKVKVVKQDEESVEINENLHYDFDRLYEQNGFYITDHFRDNENNYLRNMRNENQSNRGGDLIDDMFNYDFVYPERMLPINGNIINQRIPDNDRVYNVINRTRNHIRRNNSQNVHDSGVAHTVKKSVEKIAKTTPITTEVETALHEVKMLINTSSISDSKKKDALSVLERIAKTNGYVSTMKMDEKNVLNLVWNRINNPKNALQRDNLQDSLVNELAECVEHGTIVCTQGRASRLVDTLNMVDPEVKIRDDNTLRQEMLMKAAKVRNDVYSLLSDRDKETVNQSLENNETISKYEANVKHEIKKQLEKEYVDGNLMTKNKFETEINSWINDVV